MRVKLTIQEVIECADGDLTQAQAAKFLGVSLNSIKRFLKKNELNQEYNERLYISKNNKKLEEAIKKLKNYETITEALEDVNLNSFTKTINELYKNKRINGGHCKYCSGINDYSYGIGIYCCQKCARSYSTSKISEEGKAARLSGLAKGRRKQFEEFEKYSKAKSSGEYSIEELEAMRPPRKLTKIEYEKRWTPERRAKVGEATRNRAIKTNNNIIIEEYEKVRARDENKIIGIIYRHISPSGKSYIGQTISGSWQNRAGSNPLNSYPSKKFNNAIKKYGWENFKHEILEKNIRGRILLNDREAYWIEYYNTVENGYNYIKNINHQVEYVKALEELMELIPRITLIELYINCGKTVREIALIYGVSHPRIINLMRLYNIERRSFHELGRTVARDRSIRETIK